MSLTSLLKREKFTFKIAGNPIGLGVVGLSCDESISKLFDANVTLASEDDISFDAAIGKEAVITIEGSNGDRYIHGVINRFAQAGKKGRFNLYEANVVPQLWFLTKKKDCRIFQQKTAQEIISDILKAAQIPSDRIEFRLQESHSKNEYVVQYQETDFNFLSRLLESEGIWYFFEHKKDKHVVVFADGNSSYKPIPNAETLTYAEEVEANMSQDVVFNLSFQKIVSSGKVCQTDFNYSSPSLSLQCEQETKENTVLEFFEYPGHFQDAESGKRLSKVRLQQETALQEMGHGSTTSPLLVPGMTFKLKRHAKSAWNREYLVISVSHIGAQPQALEESADAGSQSYSNAISVISTQTVFRPARATRKPLIYGPQTAIVVGPKGEEIYTDEHGRVKVQFHWDRQGKKDEKSSCWIRVSQNSAGAGFGAMYLPRIGEEVIISFLDGDPDRPIITGRVYNGANPPPHGLPDNKTKSTIMSQSSPGGGGANELSFEDSKGSEEIYLHAQKDLTQKVENNESSTVIKNRTASVGGNESLSVSGTKNESVGKASAENVALAKALSVGGAYAVSVGAAHTVTVGAGMNTAVGAAKFEQVGMEKNVIVGKNLNTTVKGDEISEVKGNRQAVTGKQYVIQAGDSIQVVCGQSSFNMDKDGNITIKGKDIKIEGSSSVKVNGSSVDVNS